MFLRKWKTGQIAVGLMVAVFLVLSGINVMGLVQGQKAVREADARLCAVHIYKFHAAVGAGDPGEGCPEFGVRCAVFQWGEVAW